MIIRVSSDECLFSQRGDAKSAVTHSTNASKEGTMKLIIEISLVEIPKLPTKARPSRVRDVSRKVVNDYLSSRKIRRYQSFSFVPRQQRRESQSEFSRPRDRNRANGFVTRGRRTFPQIDVTPRRVPLLIRDLPYWFLRRVAVRHGVALVCARSRSFLRRAAAPSSFIPSYSCSSPSIGAWSFAFRRSADDDEVGQGGAVRTLVVVPRLRGR